jgi:DNA-binding IclR family transcriptional regulator
MPQARRAAAPPARPQADYRAPALEKGLDVLELLAGTGEGLGHSAIAQRLGRSLQEVYRVVMSLERRGYIVRRPPDDSFRLSMKLYDLAHAYPPLARLTTAAEPVLRRLALAADQALLLSVLDGIAMRPIAHIDSPAPIGFRVRLGTRRPLAGTASGRVLLAFQEPAIQRWALAALAESGLAAGALARLEARLAAIRACGYERIAGETLKGITDLSFPLLDGTGVALAAVTMPFLESVADKVSIDEAAIMLWEAAAEIAATLGGRLLRPRFPLADPLRAV